MESNIEYRSFWKEQNSKLFCEELPITYIKGYNEKLLKIKVKDTTKCINNLNINKMSDLKNVEQEDKPVLSYGQKAVGITFNPGGNPEVDRCKQMFANCIDQLHALRSKEDASGEQKRLASVAITELQGAQMWAVKALTWRD